ncbi:aminotransferase class I/II-fold pyridoxal phosphate-dependent enzyme [Algoriphagus hitonicola]|uniref:aminotransferase class I/II-fold pyridoxal phosphate-dependent enzyme n=1 Tax=Algoriphagus hitonicola TaxID=435880 RepID=UPI00360BE969
MDFGSTEGEIKYGFRNVFGHPKGAVAALNLPKSWFDELNQQYENRRKLVWQLADSLELSYTKEQSGLFVWCKLPEGKSADELVNFLLYEKNIFITPGHIFGSKGVQHVRISLCMPEFKILKLSNESNRSNHE